jgi:hypothetical protein
MFGFGIFPGRNCKSYFSFVIPECSSIKLVLECFNRGAFEDKIYRNSSDRGHTSKDESAKQNPGMFLDFSDNMLLKVKGVMDKRFWLVRA